MESAQRLGFDNTARQGKVCVACRGLSGRPARIFSNSAALTSGWSPGSSRKYLRQSRIQSSPSEPKIKNVGRQPKRMTRNPESGKATEPASREPVWAIPCAKPRSRMGIQRAMARLAVGKAPASPIPNRKRITISETAFQAAPVAAVKRDHHATRIESTRLAPMRSASQPVGI